MIVINFKNYKVGKESVKLAKSIEKYLPRAIVCPPVIDVDEIVEKTGLKVYAQHVDNVSGERGTGWVLSSVLKKVGVSGTLLNHSEHRLDFETIKETIARCRIEGLKVILCAENIAEAERFKALKPEAIAFEDKDLIGSGKSITSYRSEEIRKFAGVMKGSGIKALCGAGISNAEDVRVAFELGCDGILIA